MTIAISLLNENNHKNTGDGGNDDSVPGLKRELGTRVSSVVHLSVRVIALMHHVNRSVFVFVFVSVCVCHGSHISCYSNFSVTEIVELENNPN